VVVLNEFPSGGTYLAGGEEFPASDVVQWTIPNLPGHSATSMLWAVRANQTIINSNYRVYTQEGPAAKGDRIVITVVNNMPPPYYGDGVAITNGSATVTWLDNGETRSTVSNGVRNPLIELYLPVITK
jgi:hypothetical protein